MSPADSGSPRAAHRQEHLHGHSSVPEPVLPVPEQQEHVPQAAPTPRNDRLVLPASVLPLVLSVPPVLPASVLRSLASDPQAPRPSVLRKVDRDS